MRIRAIDVLAQKKLPVENLIAGIDPVDLIFRQMWGSLKDGYDVALTEVAKGFIEEHPEYYLEEAKKALNDFIEREAKDIDVWVSLDTEDEYWYAEAIYKNKVEWDSVESGDVLSKDLGINFETGVDQVKTVLDSFLPSAIAVYSKENRE